MSDNQKKKSNNPNKKNKDKENPQKKKDDIIKSVIQLTKEEPIKKPMSLNEDNKFLFEKEQKNIDMRQLINQLENAPSSVELLKKELFSHKDFFVKNGFILTDESAERMANLIQCIKNKIPVLLEGPTGTSKTRTTLLASKYIQKFYYKSEEDNLLRFNLSQETKIDDLISKYVGDQNSFAKIRIEDGPFLKAYRDGKILLLDEINLAQPSVLQSIQQALDNKMFSSEITGKGLVNIKMNKNFALVGTQNPNKGAFAGMRKDLPEGFLSRFQRIVFPGFTEEELVNIALGLAEEAGYENENKSQIIQDIVKLHMRWQEINKDDIHVFTIREIENIINALKMNKDLYDILVTLYGARFRKRHQKILVELFKDFPSFKNLKQKKIKISEEFPFFPHCFINDSLIDALKSIFFSLNNGRSVIITGEQESGLTQIARWCAKCFYKMTHNGEDCDNECFAICTSIIQVAELIGTQKTSDNPQNSNELLVWKDGFLLKAIIEGKCAVLDSINEAPSTVNEKLNGLLDKKNSAEEEYFDVPENPLNSKIKINEHFRLICTCNYNKLKQQSPAFLNRFDIVYLENQILKDISDEEYEKLIANMFISLEYNDKSQKKENDNEENDIVEINEDEDIDNYNADENEENNGEEENDNHEELENDNNNNQDENSNNSDKNNDPESFENNNEENNNNNFQTEEEDPIKKEENFILNNKDLIKNIILNFKKLPYLEDFENNNKDDDLYCRFRTMSTLFLLCRAIKILKDSFSKDESFHNVKNEDIIDTCFSLITINKQEDIKISKEIYRNILDILSSNKNNQDENYFFEDSESLCKFMVLIYLCSMINLHLCVIGPPGAGKTTAARAYGQMRHAILNLPDKIQKFYMNTFNSTTRPNEFFGTSTMSKKRIIFKDGNLTTAMKIGSVYIADEFNISTESTMKAVIPTLEQIFNLPMVIPGIENIVEINNRFFFIICQNDLDTFGRNELPQKLKNRLRKLYYPKQSLKEVQNICININESLYNGLNPGFKKLENEKAKKFGDLMLSINNTHPNQKDLMKDEENEDCDELKLELQNWSFRDIYKLFLRIKYQKINNDKFIDFTVEDNIIFYEMSSLNSEKKMESFIPFIKLLSKIFVITKDSQKRLINNFKSEPQIYKEIFNSEGEIKKTFYLQKEDLKIKLGTFTSNNDSSISQLEGLFTLLNAYFNILLSNKSEPLIISGPTSFKTFLSRLFLNEDVADLVSLNQETSVAQLIGSSSFFTYNEAKKFYFNQLYKILRINNINEKLVYLDNLNENKDKILNEIDEAKKREGINEKSTFFYAVERLQNLLFQERNEYDNSIINMVLEFKPGLILSAIISKKSLILKDLPNVKTVVLERLNELLTGQQHLSLSEDIQNTFTSENDKELKDFNKNFRVIAICGEGEESKLSEALLSRFTLITVNRYTKQEESIVLNSASNNIDFNTIQEMLKNYYEVNPNVNFTLQQIINCINISSAMDSFHCNSHDFNLKLSLYILVKGFIETKRNSKIPDLKDKFALNDLYESKKTTPFIKNDKIFLKSNLSNISIQANKEITELNDKKIAFTSKFVEMLEILHLGIATKTPIIFEGGSGQGKKKAIEYFANALGLNILNIAISNLTKVEDLLTKVNVETSETGEIEVKTQYTKLYEALEFKEDYPNTIIVISGIHTASKAVLEKITEFLGKKNSDILKPDGSFLKKGNAYIVIIFNSQGEMTRNKLPVKMISNSIYHIVEDPSKGDIEYIIKVLFQEANLPEIEEFTSAFSEAKEISENAINEPKITLNEVKKYIDLRKAVPNINKNLIKKFIFGYHFSEKENVQKIEEKLGLSTYEFNPTFDYDENKKHARIKISEESSEEILVDIYHPELIDKNKGVSIFKSLTKNQKHCILFLICSILAKRTPIIQGNMGSSKSFLIQILSLLLGQKANIYQLNSNSGITLFTGQSVIQNKLTKKEKEKIKPVYNSIKSLIDFTKDFEELNPNDFSEILSKLDKKIEQEELNEDEIIKYKNARKIIYMSTAPPSKFKKEESKIVTSLRNGEWVILDGIEIASPIVPEKISSLCSDKPEFNIFESGKGIYFSVDSKENPIHKDFRLFITYNPQNKGTKTLDQSLFDKCSFFTLPQIDEYIQDVTTILYNSIELENIDNNSKQDICSRIANCHKRLVKESEAQIELMAGGIKFSSRNLNFISNDYLFLDKKPNNSISLGNWIHNIFERYYWISINDPDKKLSDKLDKKKEYFKEDTINTFKKEINVQIDVNENKEANFPKIINELRKIQKAVEDTNLGNKIDFLFKEFIENCLLIQISESNLNYILNNIEDTLNLIEYNKSKLSAQKLAEFKKLNSIKIILKKIINNIDKVTSIEKGLPLNSNELIKNSSLKSPILSLHLLLELVKNGKKYISEGLIDELYKDNLDLFFNKIDKFTLEQTRNNFENLIEYLIYNPSYIPILEIFYPFQKFKDKEMELCGYFIEMISILGKKKINFKFQFVNLDNKKERKIYNFKFNEKQESKVNPDFIFDTNSLIIGAGSILSIMNNGKIQALQIKEKESNKEKTIQFISLAINLSKEKNVTIERLNKESKSKKNILKNPCQQKKLLTTSFFCVEENNLISRMWSLIYNLGQFSPTIKFLIGNLIPIESETLELIREKFLSIQDIKDIEIYVNFIGKMKSFCGTNSYLWKSQIKIPISPDKDIEEYKDMENDIEKEINYYYEIKDYWDIEKINSYIASLSAYREDIDKIILSNKKNKELEELKIKFKNLANEVRKISLNVEQLNDIKIELCKKISDSIAHPDENTYNIFKEKVESLKNFNEISIDLNTNIFNSIINPNKTIYHAFELEDLYKDIFWYSRLFEQIEFLFYNQDNINSILKTIILLKSNFETKNIGKYLSEKLMGAKEGGNLSKDNLYKVYSMLRGLLLIRFQNHGINLKDLSKVCYLFNEKIKRNKLSNEEYYFTFEECKNHNDNDKILIPKFEKNDIIFCLINYKENGDYEMGPLFKNKNKKIISHDFIEKKLENKDAIENMSSYVDIIGREIYENCMHKDLKYIKEHQDLIEAFNKRLKEKGITQVEKENINSILIGYKIASQFDEYLYSYQEKNDLYQLNFDDLKVLQNIVNKNINLLTFLQNHKEELSPQSLYFYVKNINILNNYFQNIDNFDEFFDAEKALSPKQPYLRMWVYLIRNISSINYIYFDNNDNPLSEDITKFVQNKIEENKNKNVSPIWLNFIMEKVPNEFFSPVHHLLYDFINNLSIEINKNFQDPIKKLFLKEVFELYKKIFEIEFSHGNENHNCLLNDSEFINNPDSLINNPDNYFYNKLKQLVEDKFKTFGQNCANMIEKSEQLIQIINDQKDNIKKEIIEANLKLKQDRQNEIDIERENSIEQKIEKIQDNVKNYNESLDLLSTENCVVSRVKKEKIKNYFRQIKQNQELLNKSEEEFILYELSPKNGIKNRKIFFDKKEKLIDGELLIYEKEINDEIKKRFKIIQIETLEINRLENGKFEQKKKEVIIPFDQFFDVNKKQYSKYNLKSLDIIKNFLEEKIPKEKNINPPKVEFNKTEDIFFERINGFHEYLDELIIMKNFKEGNINNKDIKVINIFNKFKIGQIKFIKETGFTNVKGYLNNLSEIFKNINTMIKTIQTELDDLSTKYSKNILPFISPLNFNKKGRLFPNSFKIPDIKNIEEYTNFNFDKIDKDKAKSLFVPIINKENSKLQCCFKALNFVFGPFCPSFYKDPIKVSLRSRLNEKIYAKICPKEQNEKEEENNEEENIRDNKGIIPGDLKNLYIDKEINQGKNIDLLITIPSLLKEDDGKEKKYRFLGKLVISTEKEFPLNSPNTLILDINIIVKTISISLLFSNDKYEMEYKNGRFYLQANELFSNEELLFKFENFRVNNDVHFKVKCKSLEGNSSNIKPKFNEENKNFIKITAPEVKNPCRLKCLFEFYFNKKDKIQLIIDAVLKPIIFSFEIYDFEKKEFKEGQTYFYVNDSLKINNFEIPLQLRITMGGNIEGIFSKKLEENLAIKDFKEKIYLNKERTIIKLKLQILQKYRIQSNPISNDVTLTIGNVSKTVQIIIKNPPILENLSQYKNQHYYEYLPEKDDFELIKKEEQLDQHRIRVGPFFFLIHPSSFFKIKYIGDRIKLEFIKDKKTSYFLLSDSSDIVRGNDIYPMSTGFLFWKTKYFPFYAETNGYWYPLLTLFNDEYFENKEIIFEIDEEDKKEIKNKIESLKRDLNENNNNENSFAKIASLIFDKNNIPEWKDSNIENRPKEIQEIFRKYNEDKSDLQFINTKIPIYNFILRLYKLMKNRYLEIQKDEYIYFIKINREKINSKINELCREYYCINSQNANKISKNDRIEETKVKILKIKQDINSDIIEIENKENQEKDISKKYLFLGTKSIKQDLEVRPNYIEINEKSNEEEALQSINIELEPIELPKIELNLNQIYNLYEKFISNIGLLPAFIGNSILKNEFKEQNLEIVSKCFNDSYNLYKSFPSMNDFSFISPITNEFKKNFEIMVIKLVSTGFNFGGKEIKKEESNKDYRKGFVIFPEIEKYTIKEEKWFSETEEEKYIFLKQNNNNNKGDWNILDGVRTEVTEINFEEFEKKDIEEYKDNKENYNHNEKIQTQKQIELNEYEEDNASYDFNEEEMNVSINEDINLDNNIQKEINNNDNEKKIDNNQNKEITYMKNKQGGKIQYKISAEKFREQDKNYNEYDTIKTCYTKMQKVNKQSKLKFIQRYEKKGQELKGTIPNENNLYPKNLHIDNEEIPINQILEDSKFIAAKLYYFAQSANLNQEIPFNNTEANIIIDVSRTIGDNDKLFNILLLCGISLGLNSLEIPYAITLIGDGLFNIVIKHASEPYNPLIFQKVLDCIFIRRCNTELASSLKICQNYYKNKNDINKLFIVLTNGLDEELCLIEQFKNEIINIKNYSFTFIFNKSSCLFENINPEKEQISNQLSSFWKDFGTSSNNISYTEVSRTKLSDELITDIAKAIVQSLVSSDKQSNNNKCEVGIFNLENINLQETINEEFLEKIIRFCKNPFKIQTEPYCQKIKLQSSYKIQPKSDPKESKIYSKSTGQIVKIKDGNLSKETKKEIQAIIKKEFKIKKELINLSNMEIIFKPNLPTQPRLTNEGTHIEITELIKYFLNPVPDPMIYVEILDGLIKNYGISIIIDNSQSCFNKISLAHSFETIRVLLSSIAAIDIPCFDLIITGEKNPFILCSEKTTIEALSEKSNVWPALFSLLFNKGSSDLASAIKAAYNINKTRKVDRTNYIFVLTDGLYSKSERQRILDNVNYCINKNILVFGIGLGVYPIGIKNLFPNIVYSQDPQKIINGIAKCFNDSGKGNEKFSGYGFDIPIIDFSQINNYKDKPIFKDLKTELENIKISFEGFPFTRLEKPKNELGDNNINENGMYEKDLLKGQKLLFALLYTEGDYITPQRIFKGKEGEECFQSSVDYYGIEIEVAQTYQDVINKLTKDNNGKCEYYACCVLTANYVLDSSLHDKFINVLIQFWKNGGALILTSDNEPYLTEVNAFLEKATFPNNRKISWRVNGNHYGTKTLIGDDSGNLSQNKTFNRKFNDMLKYERGKISYNIYEIYEGITISYAVPNISSREAITDPKLLDPFVPFSRDSDGGINSLFYCGTDNGEGDIVIDCGFTKFFIDMKKDGTPRYVQNICAWIANPEKRYIEGIMPRDFRPKAVKI